MTKHTEDEGLTCEEFIGALVDYLACDLPTEERGEMDLHLEVCPDCVKYLESYDVTIKLGKRAFAGDENEPELSEDFVKVVLSSRKKK